jgi:hypothetical protein
MMGLQFVAQASSLLYRRLPVGSASKRTHERRLEIGDTVGWKTALRALAIALVGINTFAQDATYKNDFQSAEVGQAPKEFMVLDGGFAVAEEGGNKFLELPGAPLDTYGLLFGPTEKENRTVSARVFGTGKGRRFPTFSVGLNGVGGYKLQVSPGKKALELYKGDAVKASVPFDWQTGKWTRLALTMKKAGENQWVIDGKAYEDGGKEPEKPTVTFTDTEAPTPGRASIGGSPYSTTPIRYDDLVTAPAK